MVGIKDVSAFYSEKYGGTSIEIRDREEFINPYEELLY
jgi:hypothetical protein